MDVYKSELGDFPFPRSHKSIVALANTRGASSGYIAAEAFELYLRNHFFNLKQNTQTKKNLDIWKRVFDKNIQKGIDLLKREGLTALVNAAFGKDSVPIQIGYSSSGEIVETGKNVSNFHVGDRVASNGSHAEYVVVSENLCTRLPDAVTYKEGAFTVMGSIALHGMRLSETGIGNSVVVIGLGVIGQLAVKIAEAQGSNVTCIDPDESKHGYVSNVFKTLDEALTSGDSVSYTHLTLPTNREV